MPEFETTSRAAALDMTAAHAALVARGESARPSATVDKRTGAVKPSAAELAKEVHITWKKDNPAPEFETTSRATLVRHATRHYVDRVQAVNPSAAADGANPSSMRVVDPNTGAVSVATRVPSALDLGHEKQHFVSEQMAASGATDVALTSGGGWHTHVQTFLPRPFRKHFRGQHPALAAVGRGDSP